MVVKIGVAKFKDFQIEMSDVNLILKDYPSDIAVIEDKEVILVLREDGSFPSEIVAGIIQL